MKLFVPFLLSALILVTINFTGCKKDSPTGPEGPKLYKLSGTILSEFKVPLEGVKVQIKDSVKFSDKNGVFVFYCEAKETVKLQMSDSLYFPIIQNLPINSDTSIYLNVVKVVPEHSYFPLAVGNKWSYEYTYSDKSTQEYSNVDWEITAYNHEKNTYDIKTQVISGIKITTRSTGVKDTTVVNPSTGMFQVSVEGDILNIPNAPYGAALKEGVNIRCTLNSPDQLWLNTTSGMARIEHVFLKDAGITSYSNSGYSAYEFFWGYSLKLKDYKLKKTVQ